MEVTCIKYFFKVFLPLLDRKKDRAAIRFLYRHTAFINIRKGKTLVEPNSPAANGNIIFVAKGLVNGFMTDETQEQANIWIGRPGSTYICSDFSFTGDTFNLLALEDTLLFVIDKCELEEGCAWYPALDSLFNFYILRNAMADVNNRNILFRMQYTENKIRLFGGIYPGLYKGIPADLLLSYLKPDPTLQHGHNPRLDDVFGQKLLHNPYPSMLRETYPG